MKKYVFLTFAIYGIGGTQIYARNKLLYLREKGWTPIVITEETEGEICVSELAPYRDSVVPELLCSPMLFSRKEREAVLDKLARIIGEVSDETVIESNFIMATLWGELLAKKLNVKHFIFLIQEDYSLSDVRFMKYFDFKFRRGELAGNTPVAIPKLFEGYRKLENGTAALSAYCSNTVEDCESAHDHCVIEADYHIGSIGRINKPFVLPMVKDIVRYAAANADKTFQLVMFGGTPDAADTDAVKAAVAEAPNLSVYITGPIFPVPRKLLDQMDVFVSSAGAAATSANLGYVTIVIDANDFEPIGVLGHTTNELVHRIPGTAHESTQTLLRQILVEHRYQKKEIASYSDGAEYRAAFEKHMAFLEKSAADRAYYPIRKVGPRWISRMLYRWRKHEY